VIRRRIFPGPIPKGAPPIDWPFPEAPLTGRPLPEMPDWADPTAYPKPDDLSLRQWGWEFLRRNPEYQLDWAHDELKPGRWGLPEAVDPASKDVLEVLKYPPSRDFRARPDKYLNYLRVWDARRDGVDYLSIGMKLYPERRYKDDAEEDAAKKDAAQKDMDAAWLLVWFTYRELLLR
jgi:hypothetical protein